MESGEDKKSVLEGCVAAAKDLAGLVEYSEDSIVSKALLDKSVGTITLFAFDRGQALSEHSTPYDAVLQVLDGRASVMIDGEGHEVGKGQVIIMPADRPHSVSANERFKMLLTMIRG